ncbi:MAG: phenylalanine--tRNA ligase subunit alpha, partial [Candidatus Bathyarchaeia archaeon]
MSELRENEQKTLIALRDAGGRESVQKIVESTGLAHAAVMRAALSLSTRNLVKIHERKRTKITLNDEGMEYARDGLPERRLIEALIKLGGEAPIGTVLKEASLDRSLSVIALGWSARKGWAKIERETRRMKLLREPSEEPDERLLSILNREGSLTLEELDRELQEAFYLLKRRKIVEVDEETLRELELTENGWELAKRGLRVVEEISQLSPDLIVTGRWRKIKIRRYNIKAPVARIWPGKKHPYLMFLDEVKEKLVAFGFKEMTGPIVELSFFNCDSLYMPQDHPAREIHDMYFIKAPAYGDLSAYREFLDNVKETHENGWKTGSKGWGYSFSAREAERLMLRSQTTSVSNRTLLSKDLEIPGKYFSIARCYRPDVIDRTHLTEFNQIEGIVVGEGLTLRDLLGVLEKFALEIAEADKIKFRPGYFPFTEPSVELHAYKEGYGWMEFGGSGIFRPEVTLPLGVNVPVLAWGLGVDRLFMMKAGIDDIRYLFTRD